MRIKKILIPIISAIFLITVISVSLSAFTVKEVNVSFSTYIKQDGAGEIQEALNKYNGKNLLFIKTDKIVKEIEEDPYFKVYSVEKNYPNVLKISIEERKEVFGISYKNKGYFAPSDSVSLSFYPQDKTTSVYPKTNYAKDVTDTPAVMFEQAEYSTAYGSNGATNNDTYAIKHYAAMIRYIVLIMCKGDAEIVTN